MTQSEDHAEVEQHGRSYLLADLASSNGTSLNGRRLDRPTKLRNGDVVQVGSFRLEFSVLPTTATAKTPALAIELSEDERAVAVALVAPYRAEESFAARPSTRQVPKPSYGEQRNGRVILFKCGLGL
jgi:adenylate cyclase